MTSTPLAADGGTLMNEAQAKAAAEEKALIEREARLGRRFTLADAIGKLAGPGAMKGVSPIARLQQAEAEIADFLRFNLAAPPGLLGGVVSRRINGSELLLNNFGQPLVVLAACVQRALVSEHLLKALVREADIEWGRVFGERPHFEQEGRPPHPDDPYTLDSVRSSLSQLLDKLVSAAARTAAPHAEGQFD